jgi:20S proteasome alpha/beta subunit
MGGLTEFEHEVPKIKRLTDRIVAMISGDALKGSQLASAVRAVMPAGGTSVQQVAQVLADQYGALRRAQLDAELFGPRGLSLEIFYAQGGQTRMVPQIAGGIDQQVMQFNLGIDLLIAGVDDEGGHLFSVHNPGGAVNDFAPIGFASVGSGTLHATQSLIGFRHTSARDLHQTVFSVYASKRRAEVAPGVGLDTDLAIIRESGIHYVAPEIVAQLATLFDEYEQPVVQDIREKVAQLNVLPGGNAHAVAN